jgi:hypothetical protein
MRREIEDLSAAPAVAQAEPPPLPVVATAMAARRAAGNGVVAPKPAEAPESQAQPELESPGFDVPKGGQPEGRGRDLESAERSALTARNRDLEAENARLVENCVSPLS